MKKSYSYICVLVILIFSFSSCDKNRVFDENQTIEDNSWDKNNKLRFKAEITDTTANYNVYVNIRNAGWYPFSNIFIFLTAKLPNGGVAKDTLECTLANAEGRWLGDGSGDIWDNRILFKKNFRFPIAGTYDFQMEQAMRMNPLLGIMDAGIRIEKAEEKK